MPRLPEPAVTIIFLEGPHTTRENRQLSAMVMNGFWLSTDDQKARLHDYQRSSLTDSKARSLETASQSWFMIRQSVLAMARGYIITLIEMYAMDNPARLEQMKLRPLAFWRILSTLKTRSAHRRPFECPTTIKVRQLTVRDEYFWNWSSTVYLELIIKRS
jgi:hypothetical protein